MEEVKHSRPHCLWVVENYYPRLDLWKSRGKRFTMRGALGQVKRNYKTYRAWGRQWAMRIRNVETGQTVMIPDPTA